MLSQPGRLGGDKITPLLLFNGPPQLIPIPCNVVVLIPCCCSIDSAVLNNDSIIGYTGLLVGNTSFCLICKFPFSSVAPRITAHLVPPISKPNNMLVTIYFE